MHKLFYSPMRRLTQNKMVMIWIQTVSHETNKRFALLHLQLGNGVSKLGSFAKGVLENTAYRFCGVKLLHALKKPAIIVFVAKNVSLVCPAIKNMVIFFGYKLNFTHTVSSYHLETPFPSGFQWS